METVVGVKVLKPYVLDVTFSDGTRRQINVEHELFGELFEPLREPRRFAEAAVDEVLGTVVWPNGADLSPEFLYYGSSEGVGIDQPIREFVDADDEYESWTAKHPDGFVVNAERRPRPSYLVLHRATCRTITGQPARGVAWTKDYIKFCSRDRRALDRWAAGMGGTLRECQLCNPTS